MTNSSGPAPFEAAQVIFAGPLEGGQGIGRLLQEVCRRADVAHGLLQIDDGSLTGYLGIENGSLIFGAVCLPGEAAGFDALSKIFGMRARQFAYLSLQERPAALNQALKLEISQVLAKAGEVQRLSDRISAPLAVTPPNLQAETPAAGPNLATASTAKTARKASQPAVAQQEETAEELQKPLQAESFNWMLPLTVIGILAAATLLVLTTCILYAKSCTIAAQEALRAGKNEIAIAECNKAIMADSRQTAPYLLRALALSRVGKHAEAIDDYSKVVAVQAQNSNAFLGRAVENLAVNNPEKALADAQAALTIDANLSRAYLISGMAHLKEKQYDKATEDCRQYLKKDRGASSQQRLSDVYTVLAEAHQEGGQFGQAILYYNKAMGSDPSGELLLKRAQCFVSAGDFQHALADANKAISLEKTTGALMLRARCYQALGNAHSALADLNRAVAISPKDPLLLKQRAELEGSLNNWSAACADLKAVTAMSPDDDDAQSKLRLASAKLSMGGSTAPTQAGQSASDEQRTPAIKLTGNADELTKQGYNFLRNGQLDEAEQALTQALRLQPNNFTARRYLAHALSANGQEDAAVEQFAQLSKVVSLSPADELALGRSLNHSGAPAQAVAHFQNCLSAQPSNRDARLELIDLYDQMGNSAEAKRQAMEGAIRATNKQDTELFRDRLKRLERPKPAPEQDQTIHG
jgi:tetratricopeptide (TPR) repeat protein